MCFIVHHPSLSTSGLCSSHTWRGDHKNFGWCLVLLKYLITLGWRWVWGNSFDSCSCTTALYVGNSFLKSILLFFGQQRMSYFHFCICCKAVHFSCQSCMEGTIQQGSGALFLLTFGLNLGANMAVLVVHPLCSLKLALGTRVCTEQHLELQFPWSWGNGRLILVDECFGAANQVAQGSKSAVQALVLEIQFRCLKGDFLHSHLSTSTFWRIQMFVYKRSLGAALQLQSQHLVSFFT